MTRSPSIFATLDLHNHKTNTSRLNCVHSGITLVNRHVLNHLVHMETHFLATDALRRQRLLDVFHQHSFAAIRAIRLENTVDLPHTLASTFDSVSERLDPYSAPLLAAVASPVTAVDDVFVFFL